MVRIQASVSKGWLNTNAGFEFIDQYYLDPIFRFEQDKRIDEYLEERFADTPLYNMEDNLVQTEFRSRNQLLFGAIQPNMIIAALLGANFNFYLNKDADVEGCPLASITSPDLLPSVKSLISHPLITELVDQMESLSQKRADLRVIPPFFWDLSGRATIHGIITTSLKLVGQNIFLMMYENKELVHSIHQWIVDVYSNLICFFSDFANIPITSVHIGECSGVMLSPKLFEEFIVPYQSQLGRNFKALRLHSCGNSTALLPVMAKVESISVLDVGSGTSIAKAREIFGDALEINTFPKNKILAKGEHREVVFDWVKNTIDENNSGPLKIAFHVEESYDIENCLAIFDMVRSLEKQA